MVGIGGKGFFHILMNFLLQVVPERLTVGADNYIAAYPALGGDVAIGVGDPLIGSVINAGDADLRPGGADECGGALIGFGVGGGKEQDADDSQEQAQ